MKMKKFEEIRKKISFRMPEIVLSVIVGKSAYHTTTQKTNFTTKFVFLKPNTYETKLSLKCSLNILFTRFW